MITSSIIPCEDCDLEKIRLQDLLNSTSSHSSKPAQRIYIDTSWVNCNIYGGNNYWFILLDKLSGMIWSRFENNKSDLNKKVMPVIKNIQSTHPISYIRCNNEGENQILND